MAKQLTDLEAQVVHLQQRNEDAIKILTLEEDQRILEKEPRILAEARPEADVSRRRADADAAEHHAPLYSSDELETVPEAAHEPEREDQTKRRAGQTAEATAQADRTGEKAFDVYRQHWARVHAAAVRDERVKRRANDERSFSEFLSRCPWTHGGWQHYGWRSAPTQEPDTWASNPSGVVNRFGNIDGDGTTSLLNVAVEMGNLAALRHMLSVLASHGRSPDEFKFIEPWLERMNASSHRFKPGCGQTPLQYAADRWATISFIPAYLNDSQRQAAKDATSAQLRKLLDAARLLVEAGSSLVYETEINPIFDRVNLRHIVERRRASDWAVCHSRGGNEMHQMLLAAERSTNTVDPGRKPRTYIPIN